MPKLSIHKIVLPSGKTLATADIPEIGQLLAYIAKRLNTKIGRTPALKRKK